MRVTEIFIKCLSHYAMHHILFGCGNGGVSEAQFVHYIVSPLKNAFC